MDEANPSGRPLLDALERGTNTAAAASRVEIELFCVRIGSGLFGVESGMVHEVVRIAPITPIPGSPSFLCGVTTHRGSVLAVIDLGRFLGHGETRITARTRMAIVRADDLEVAFLTDEVLGLSRFKASSILPAPLGADAGTEYISGVVMQAQTLHVLDLRRAISAARARAVARR